MSEGPTIGDWTQYGWVPDNASSFPARIRLRDTAWMVYYEPDVTGLKAEVLLLRKENAELRERVDAAHTSRLLTENENEDLRTLFTDFWTWADPPFALKSGTFEQFMDIAERARELGVVK